MTDKEFKIRFLNKKYFQKSTFFLYPLLNIPKTILPKNTYITWEDTYGIDDLVFICKFDKFNSETQIKTEKVHLKGHPLLKETMTLEDGGTIYFFKFEKYSKLWHNFVNGKYSKISKNHKLEIIKFYKKGSFTGTLIKSYLFPEDYYADYAELLNVPLEVLMESGELADAPDLKQENLNLKSLIKKQK
jgi:hypothetical protein